MFGNIRLVFGTIWKIFGNLRKIIRNAVISMSMWQKDNYTLAWSDEFYVLVARTISHSFAALTREILFLPLEHKIHIFSQPCNILYISCHIFFFPEMYRKNFSCGPFEAQYSKRCKNWVFFPKGSKGTPALFTWPKQAVRDIKDTCLAWGKALKDMHVSKVNTVTTKKIKHNF